MRKRERLNVYICRLGIGYGMKWMDHMPGGEKMCGEQ
jgi:hypothetical protein